MQKLLCISCIATALLIAPAKVTFASEPSEKFGVLTVQYSNGRPTERFVPLEMPVHRPVVSQSGGPRRMVGWKRETGTWNTPQFRMFGMQMNSAPDGTGPLGFLFVTTHGKEHGNYSVGCMPSEHQPPCNPKVLGIHFDPASGVATFRKAVFSHGFVSREEPEREKETITVSGELRIPWRK